MGGLLGEGFLHAAIAPRSGWRRDGHPVAERGRRTRDAGGERGAREENAESARQELAFERVRGREQAERAKRQQELERLDRLERTEARRVEPGRQELAAVPPH